MDFVESQEMKIKLNEEDQALTGRNIYMKK